VTLSADDPAGIADRLHSAAIHLLRRLRRTDADAGLTGPQASALSVLAFGGPAKLTDLAAAEQVRAPTMSRLVSDLERLGLVERRASPQDRRAAVIAATEHGRALLEDARAARLGALTASVARRTPQERALLARAVALLAEIAADRSAPSVSALRADPPPPQAGEDPKP
jgi:DNA-binding MarR family transcriptional regulator